MSLEVMAGLAARGGLVLAVLALISIFAVALILLKGWQFYRVRPDADQLEVALSKHARGEAAVKSFEEAGGWAASVFAVALEGKEKPESMLPQCAAQEMGRLQDHLRLLEAVGALSPLIGLLGTVTGMIRAFRDLEAAGVRVDPSVLSGGIWEALLTTAAGLIVAIPALAALSFFDNQAERIRLAVNEAASRFLAKS